MIRIKILAWVMLALGFQGCKTYQTDNLPSTQLRFGSGGGFTGALTEYLLLGNGQLFVRKSLEADYEPLGKIKKREAKILYNNWERKISSKEAFQHPGNMYYFVNMTKDGKEHRLTWGSNDFSVGEDLKTFYKDCNAMIKEMNEMEKKSGS